MHVLTRELGRLIAFAAATPTVVSTQQLSLDTLKDALAGESDFGVKLLAVLMNCALDVASHKIIALGVPRTLALLGDVMRQSALPSMLRKRAGVCEAC